MKCDIKKSATFLGYNGFLKQNLDPENAGDMHEAFNIGPDKDDGNENHAMSSPNLWPTEDLPDFKGDTLKY